MEIFSKSGVLNVVSNSKAIVSFDINSKEVKINDLEVSFPGEYEKSGILLEVKEYAGILFYSFTMDSKHLVIIANYNFELKEDILSFFGDVDILIIPGAKETVKIYESIEARVVIPYGPGKQAFLIELGQNIEEVNNYKIKGELLEDKSEFVNLSE